MKKLSSESVNLILTDPPYNATSKTKLDLPNNTTGGPFYRINENWDVFKDFADYLKFTRSWIKEANRLLVPNGSVMICCSYHSLGEILISLKELDYKILNVIVWKKTNAMPNITKRTLTHSTEFVIWAAKGKGWTFNYFEMKKYNNGKQLRDVWELPLCQGPERIKNMNGRAAHPTQKPIALFVRLLEMSSISGDVVLDPFMGIGTTAIACIGKQRSWIGIEKNLDYVKLAKKRIKNFGFKKTF